MNVVVLVENFVQKNYPPRRRVYAIRDFPPFYGSNVSSFNKKKVVVQKKCWSQEKFKENLQELENLQVRKSHSIGKVTNLVEGVETWIYMVWKNAIDVEYNSKITFFNVKKIHI